MRGGLGRRPPECIRSPTCLKLCQSSSLSSGFGLAESSSMGIARSKREIESTAVPNAAMSSAVSGAPFFLICIAPPENFHVAKLERPT